MKRIVLIILLLLIATNLFSINTEEITQYIMHYFQNRTDEVVDITIEYFQDVEQLDQNLTNIYLAFYSTVFKDKEIKNKVLAGIENKANKKVIEYFYTISKTNIDDYYVGENYSQELNDMIWASYFANGDIKYLEILYKIIDGSSLLDLTQNLFYTRVSAAWFMASNSGQYNEVKKFLELKNSNISKLLIRNNEEDFDNIIKMIEDDEKKRID